MEKVDILLPPTFEKSGVIKTKEEAWDNQDWIGIFNLWIIRSIPEPSVVYQVRSPNSSLAPNLLDVTAGGHYMAGEIIADGMREVEEELGRRYNMEDLVSLGKKIYMGYDTKKRIRHNIVDVFMVKDNAPLEEYMLQKEEMYAICSFPIQEIINIFTKIGCSYDVAGITSSHKPITIHATKESFPPNFDNYHFKIALLADRFIKGEKYLVY